MKILFLDIDGPLAIGKNFLESRFYITPELKKVKSIIEHNMKSEDKLDINDCVKVPYGWHDKSCDALSKLIEKLDLKIVISSDWRRHYTRDEIKKIFAFNKIQPESVIGETEIFAWGGGLERARLAEISTWVENWEAENEQKLQWVAVDDMNLSALGENHYVYTNDGIAAPGVATKIEDSFKRQ
jgi:hypothetical protein